MNRLIKSYLVKLGRHVAPRTMRNVRTLSILDQQFEQGPARFIDYERELRALRREIDELRRDNRRVAELYDVVFEWAKRDAVARGVAPHVDSGAGVERISDDLSRRLSASE